MRQTMKRNTSKYTTNSLDHNGYNHKLYAHECFHRLVLSIGDMHVAKLGVIVILYKSVDSSLSYFCFLSLLCFILIALSLSLFCFFLVSLSLLFLALCFLSLSLSLDTSIRAILQPLRNPTCVWSLY